MCFAQAKRDTYEEEARQEHAKLKEAVSSYKKLKDEFKHIRT